MTMPAMRTENNVIGSQMRTDRAGDRFFTDVCMARPMNQPSLVAASQFFFRLSNDLHFPVEAQASLCNVMIRHQKFDSSLYFSWSANRADRRSLNRID